MPRSRKGNPGMKYVFLHGLGQTAASWDGVVPLVDGPAEVLCPDLSRLLRGREVDYPNLYAAFCEYCGELSEPLNLCGLSLGGVIALQYCLEHPEKVRAMALIGTQYVMPKGLLKVQNAVFHLLPARAFQDMGFEKRDVIRLSNSMMELDFRRDLKRITCPVLVMCGEKDKANRQAAIQLAEQIPSAEFAGIAGAGHEVNTQAPRELGRALDSFFRGIK